MPEDAEKACRAAAHPDRPGEVCRAALGVWVPVVDRSRCEGHAHCAEVCPCDVFEVRRIDDADFARLSWFGKLESLLRGRKAAHTPKADACRACGLCVVACAERAVTLVRCAP